MIIYHDTSPALLTPKVNKMIDSYVDVFHRKKLRSADLPSLVGELTGYVLISTDVNCGGWQDRFTKEIALNPRTWDPIDCLLHEMSHAIQSEVEAFEKHQGMISEDLMIEWQANTMAKEMRMRMYPDMPINPRAFKSYFNLKDWQFLIDWYGVCRQNDIEHIMVKYNESRQNPEKIETKDKN